VLRLKVFINKRRILILLRINTINIISILLKIIDSNKGGSRGGNKDNKG
jgi:hypothetical protein